MFAFILGVSWKICFIYWEVLNKEKNIKFVSSILHSYFLEGFLKIIEFLKGYANIIRPHPYTFLKTPEQRVFSGFEVKKYLIHKEVWLLNGMAQSQRVILYILHKNSSALVTEIACLTYWSHIFRNICFRIIFKVQ